MRKPKSELKPIKAKKTDDVYDTFVFDRSDLDRVSAIYPKGHILYPDGKQMTFREELEKSEFCFFRNDIAMVNIGKGKVINQICAYAYVDGTVQWNGIKDYFTLQEQDEIEEIAHRMFDQLDECPKLIRLMVKKY